MKKDPGEIVIRISPFVSNEEKIEDILVGLRGMKSALAQMSVEYENDQNAGDIFDGLTDALESIDNTIDALNDVTDEMDA